MNESQLNTVMATLIPSARWLNVTSARTKNSPIAPEHKGGSCTQFTFDPDVLRM